MTFPFLCFLSFPSLVCLQGGVTIFWQLNEEEEEEEEEEEDVCVRVCVCILGLSRS